MLLIDKFYLWIIITSIDNCVYLSDFYIRLIAISDAPATINN